MSSSSSPPSSSHSISIRELRLEDYDEVKNFLSKHFFATEPLMSTPGENTAVPEFEDEFHLSLIRQGLSLVAIDENHGNRIVGVALAQSQVPNDLDEQCREVEQRQATCLIDKIHKFLSNLEKRANVFSSFGVERALYLYMLGVDTTVRRQGVGSRLVSSLIDLGRSKAFPVIYVTCTNQHSTKLTTALNFKCVDSQTYADYKDEQGKQVLQPPAPHTKASVMAQQL
ncbi:uncharacterized protein Dwil_GK14749 [Drosophila willistoni]|uniref:aralkylamine N-acetyltransferase n=1 Tax=Drosophila willistoni TaxID=7260 RepID=B4MUT5_DROWI|nr:arylalkylamine N-acetyltransferase-like 2 [Drosophila willistoni]EDW76280.1 uncharacterized protein Dwil_GK14749 [Drosophila willistoni]